MFGFQIMSKDLLRIHKVIFYFFLVAVIFIIPSAVLAQKNTATSWGEVSDINPQISRAWLAYYVVAQIDEPPYPRYNNTKAHIQLFVEATYQGITKLYGSNVENNNPATWLVVGNEGPLNPDPVSGFTNFPNLQTVTGYTTIDTWPAMVGSPVILFYESYVFCNAYKKGYRKYFMKDVLDEAGIPWAGGTDKYIVRGLHRYYACVIYNGTKIETPKKEKALRICARETAYHTQNALRTAYVNWLFAYLHTPYEYGGMWFGGKTNQNWVLQGSYYGYGIDCSAIVSAGAKWAGYNWNTGYGIGNWRYTTTNLTTVTTTTFPLDDPFGVGDILNKVGSHVVTVIDIDGDDIVIIEAAGEEYDAATYIWSNRNKNASQVRVVKVKLSHYIGDSYIKRRLVPRQ